MDIFDKMYLSTYQYVKKFSHKHAKSCARRYVSLIQIGLLMSMGILFVKFSKQMNFIFLNDNSTWVIFILISLFIFFKNWMTYNRKKHAILNSNKIIIKNGVYSIFGLISYQVLIFTLSLIMCKA